MSYFTCRYFLEYFLVSKSLDINKAIEREVYLFKIQEGVVCKSKFVMEIYKIFEPTQLKFDVLASTAEDHQLAKRVLQVDSVNVSRLLCY